MKRKLSHIVLSVALAFITVGQLSVGVFSTILPTAVITAAAETLPKEVTHMDPEPLDNIILNAYCVPMFDEAMRREQFQYCKDAGIDVLSHVYPAEQWVATDHTVGWYKQAMQEASEYGLTLMTRDVRLQGANALSLTDAELRAIAEEYKDLPGFGGFYLVDEPYNPSPYARVENALRDVCPDTLVNVNFLPRGAYPEGTYIRQLTDYGSLMQYTGTLSLDVYCFDPNGGVNETALFGNYEDLRQAGLITGNNTAVYVQSVGSSQHGYRRPDAGDLRYNMMAALAYGVKEIKFFCWGTPRLYEGNYTDAIIDRDGNPTDLYAPVCEINADVHRIGQYIAACDAVEVYHSRRNVGVYTTIPSDYFVQVSKTANVIVSLMQERNGDHEYVMLVNKDFNAVQTFTCTFDGVDSLQIVDENGDLQPLAMTDGAVTLTLAAGDGVLIALPEGSNFFASDEEQPAETVNLATDAIVTASTSQGSEGWYVYNLTDGNRLAGGESSENGWRTVDSTDAYILLDFGRVLKFNRIDLYSAGTFFEHGLKFPKNITISVSNDGKTFTEIKTISDMTPTSLSGDSITFNTQIARYMRLDLTGAKRKDVYVALNEIEVYYDNGNVPAPEKFTLAGDNDTIVDYTDGENIALNKPAFASSTTPPEFVEWGGWSLKFINDGRKTYGGYPGGWTSNVGRNSSADATEFVGIDFCDVFAVEKVVLQPRGCFPVDYTVEMSMDGVEWTTIYSAKGASTPTEDVVLTPDTPATGRFLRVTATKLTGGGKDGYLFQLAEIEAYGKPVCDPTSLQEALAIYKTQGGDKSARLYTNALSALNNPFLTQTRANDYAAKLLEAVGYEPETESPETNAETIPPETGEPDTTTTDTATDTVAETPTYTETTNESHPADETAPVDNGEGCSSVIGLLPAVATVAATTAGVIICRRRKE